MANILGTSCGFQAVFGFSSDAKRCNLTKYSPKTNATFQHSLVHSRQGFLGQEISPTWPQPIRMCQMSHVSGELRNLVFRPGRGQLRILYRGRDGTEMLITVTHSSRPCGAFQPSRKTAPKCQLGTYSRILCSRRYTLHSESKYLLVDMENVRRKRY